jgi:hypothetical protein
LDTTHALQELRASARAETIDAVSHLARRWKRSEGNYLWVSPQDALRWFQEARLASPPEQLHNLILWLGSAPSSNVDPAALTNITTPELASIVGGRSINGSMKYLIDYAVKKGWVEDCDSTKQRSEVGIFILRLTVDGWARFDDLTRTTNESMTAFMAMAFRDLDANRAYTECFVPAVEDAGFKLRRLDEGQGAGLIDNQLRVAIRACKFLVADLSTRNRGAYWEAGFAEGLGKHVIYVCEETAFASTDPEVRPHFDTNHLVTVKWSLSRLAEVRSELTATIRNTFFGDASMPSS